MIKLKLKDGSVREIEKAMPASEIIKDIGMGLYKAACCVKLDGEVFDMRTVFTLRQSLQKALLQTQASTMILR